MKTIKLERRTRLWGFIACACILGITSVSFWSDDSFEMEDFHSESKHMEISDCTEFEDHSSDRSESEDRFERDDDYKRQMDRYWTLNANRMLRVRDISVVQYIIDSVPAADRLDFLRKVLVKIDIRIRSIQNSERLPRPSDIRTLAFLSEAKNLVQTRIDFIVSGWTTGTGSTTPPIISDVAVVWTNSNSTTLRVTVNESGTGYYVVLPIGSAMPSAFQIKSGQTATGQTVILKGSGSLVSWTNRLALTGLAASTGYVVYFTAEDVGGNLQPIVQGALFYTAMNGTVLPIVPTISVDSVFRNDARFSVAGNENDIGC